ncbi:MAG: methylmalonyl-CoA mutase family protein [Chloroflexi bacterium]|nr:methylmalonyl-CoA mutase family protein [Chloroflexota bacterium]
MSSSKQEWQKNTYGPAVQKAKERQEVFETLSNIPVEPLYGPEDRDRFDYNGNIGYPGEYPFTRGIQPTMYRGRFWTMRQYAGFASAEDSNKRYRYLLSQGQTGLSVAFDLPTQIGYDSDHPLSRGEVGKVGVPISHLKDMEALFQDIPLDKVSTSMTINATAPILLAFYVAVGKKQGFPPDKLNGTVQNDILKEYIARGTYRFPPQPSMRLITDLFAYCSKNVPKWNTISISGYHMREAGATAPQELAFTFADAIEYVNAAVRSGLAVDDFAPNLSFFFVSQSNLLEEVAKFRAARRIWARIMKEQFKAKNPRSLMLRFHTQTAGVSLTAQQPENNIIRTAIEALAAVLGGTQSLHTNSFDEALALPSDKAVTIALRTQQIIAHESGVTETIDPLAGSYFVEHLTDKLEQETQAYLKKIEQMGGALKAIEQGYQQKEIQESAFRFQREVETRRRIVVGVNDFITEEPPVSGIMRINPEAERHQVERLHEVRRKRDQRKVAASLRRLDEVAHTQDNTMPVFVECVESYATIGEICSTLEKAWNIYKPASAL